jgi:hypothetical protein
MNAVDVVCEAQEQRLEALRIGQTTASACGERAFGGGEDALDPRAQAVPSGREVGPHLGTNAMKLPGGLARLAGMMLSAPNWLRMS